MRSREQTPSDSPLSMTHHESTAATVSRLVEALIVKHEALLVAMDEHREALRTADSARLAQATQTTGELLEAIARLEDQRRAVVGPNAAGMTLAQIAATAPEPDRDTLLSLGDTLRSLIERAKGERRTLVRAAGALARHMDGLTRQVAAALSHAGTYSRQGVVESGPSVVSGLDVMR